MHLFVDNLTNVDFSYLDPKRGMLGETWLASISLEGALDAQGMVCDFGIVKKTVRNWLDATIDHCLIVANNPQYLDIHQQQENTSLQWRYAGRYLQCESPAAAITVIDGDEVTPDMVSRWCVEQLRELLPDTIDRITLTFTPENIPHDYYHYSHGLKKHDGNCQRIAHGHRSTIEIIRDDERDHELERQWCQLWEDIYIGTESDLIETRHIDGKPYYHFAYRARQGDFSLTMPVEDCYLIQTDSTVEFIAQHIANTLKAQNPINDFIVQAYEGIGKGATAYSGT